MIFCTITSSARSICWHGFSKNISIGDQVEIFEDEQGEFYINDIMSGKYDDQFVKSEKKIINFGFTESYYWIKFSLNNSTGDDLILEIAQASLKTAELYHINNKGNISVEKSGYKMCINKKKHISHYQVFSLPKGDTDIYLKVMSNTSPFPIRIWEQRKYEVYSYKQRIVFGIYFGLMLFVVITNIFFFVSLRKKIYLYYAFVVVIYSCYASIVLDGFILYFFPKMDLMLWYVTIPTIGVIAQTAYSIFFLELKKHASKLYRIGIYIVAYFSIYALIRPLLSLTTSLAINTVHAMISFFIMGYFGFSVARKGNKIGNYYAIAYIIYFSMVVIEAVYIQTGKPTYVGGLSHVALATLVEALILSFLLSKRTEWERIKVEKEKLNAQKKLFDSLKENERIIKEQNLELENKVIERTLSLKNVNKELEVAIASKDKFFSIMAHDLKSPFSSLLGLTEILIIDFDDFSGEEKLRYINLINQGLNNTHSLLENLLVWSQSQRGILEFNKQQVNLKEVVRESLLFVNQQVDAKGVILENNIKDDLLIMVDKNMILTVLRNLLINAIKFTPKYKGIELYIDKYIENGSGKMVSVVVKDQGVGMSPDQQKILFDITKNVSKKGTNNEGGTGLGLIICHEFILKHKGQIWVESELGKGTSFFFTLPLFSGDN